LYGYGRRGNGNRGWEGEGHQRKTGGHLKAVVADAEETAEGHRQSDRGADRAARAKGEESLKAAKDRLAEQESAMMAKTMASLPRPPTTLVRANPWKSWESWRPAGFVIGILAARLGAVRGGGENDPSRGAEQYRAPRRRWRSFSK